jgi:hypothetical protein
LRGNNNASIFICCIMFSIHLVIILYAHLMTISSCTCRQFDISYKTRKIKPLLGPSL